MGPVDIVVRDPQGREARITIEILAEGGPRVATQRIRTQRIDSLTGRAVAGLSPDVLFQRFAVRMPENTEMTSSGMRVRTTASPEKIKAKSFTFILYYRYTLRLFSFTGRVPSSSTATGRIGDAILRGSRANSQLQGLHPVVPSAGGPDDPVFITNAGFSWPEFCIRISMALQIPGFDGFFEQWDFCRGEGGSRHRQYE